MVYWDFEDSDLAALVGYSISQPQMENRPAESLGLEEDPMKLSSSGRLSGSNNGSDQLKFLCLVDGCRADLSRCREYHRRHRVCELHSKAPVVVVRGEQKRYCQQCSRFHSLVDFDEVKRSCRKRLKGHNQRRRKPKPESFYFSSHFFFSAYKGPRILQFSNPRVCATTNVRCIRHVKDKKGRNPCVLTTTTSGCTQLTNEVLPIPSTAEEINNFFSCKQMILKPLQATEQPPQAFMCQQQTFPATVAAASPKSTKSCALYLLSSHPTQNSVSGLNHLAQSTVTTTHPCSHDVEDRPVNPEMMFPMRPDGF